MSALLCAAVLVAACVETPQDVSLSERGADALEAGDYTAAEQFLGDALEYNPGNEFALLNLGVVYQDTGRPELARRTYAEIIRLNRLERAAQTVARRGQGVEPTALARVNLADLNLSPVAVESPAEPSPQTASTVPIESGNYAALHGDMSAIFNKLEALADSMRLMSDTLRAAAEEAERQDAIARAENSAGDVPSAVPDVAATEHRAEAVEALEASAEPAMAKTSQGDDMVASRDEDTKDGMAEDDEAAQAIARAEEVGSGGPSVRVHIASFRSEEGAERGWQILRRNHAELLGGLDLQVRRIDFGAEMGVFYRVQAGPLDNEQGAKELYERLKSRGLYFAAAFF